MTWPWQVKVQISKMMYGLNLIPQGVISYRMHLPRNSSKSENPKIISFVDYVYYVVFGN